MTSALRTTAPSCLLTYPFLITATMMDLLGFENYDDLKDAHNKWTDSAMQSDNCDKENKWTQSIAVGSKTFIERMKEALGSIATGRKIICADDNLCIKKKYLTERYV